MLAALRRRHDLSRYEYTRIVRIVPGGDTFAIPILTLGNRFAENEDLLLSTYLHEQMHWYLWYLGTPEHDPWRRSSTSWCAAIPMRRPSCPTARATTRRPTASGRQLARGGGHLRVHRPRARLRGRRGAAQLPLDLSHRAARTGTCWASFTSATAWSPSAARRNCSTRECRRPRKRVAQRRRAKKARSSARGPRLLDPAVDLRRVVAGRLAEDARPVLDAAALGIGRAEIEPADARKRDRRRAHRARLQRDVEVGVRRAAPTAAPRRPARIASISACAVGSASSRVRLPARPSTPPSAPTTTAPTGTSPRAPAASASARAASIWLWAGRGVIRAAPATQ